MNNWYEDFFTGIVLEMWRKAVSPEQTVLECDFLEKHLKLKPGDHVLDVPCGLGRHSIELAARGFHLSGVDYSSEAIRYAREEAANLRRQIEWISADMCDLKLNSKSDAAFCFGNSFGFLEPVAMRNFVDALSKVLKTGARFALDSGMAAESILPHLQERQWAQIDDILFLEENRYHVPDSCLETVYTFVKGEEKQVRSGFHWIYTIREIRNLLGHAGFVVKEMFASLQGDPFIAGSPYLLLIAQKE